MQSRPGEFRSEVKYSGEKTLIFQSLWLHNSTAFFYAACRGGHWSSATDASSAFNPDILVFGLDEYEDLRRWAGWVQISLELPVENWRGGFLFFTEPHRKPGNWASLNIYYDEGGRIGKVILSGYSERQESETVGYNERLGVFSGLPTKFYLGDV